MPGPILTCVYAAPEDDGFVEKTTSVVERHGGEVAFVRLCCAPGINERRIVAEDRRAFGKITSVDSLRSMQTRWRLNEVIPFQNSLEIDNSALDVVGRHIPLPYSVG